LKKIFIFVDYYLPGFKFGGPLRTIANMVERLSSSYQFFIFTFDRDEGDTEPYSNILREGWNKAGPASVFYTSDRSLRQILKRIDEVSPDMVYLNSFFSRVSIKVLLARKLGMLRNIPILLAPRGEFAAGALMIKPLRKRMYIGFANKLGLLRAASLHASSEYEKSDIERHLRKDELVAEPVIASNLAASKDAERAPRRMQKVTGCLRLIFLSRVIQNKNLDGALKMLPGLSGKISLSIFGPIGNEGYWKECQQLISEMPNNLAVEYRGMLEHDKVHQAFSEHDLLLLPTMGENYGHVILESMMAGCPVLISDRTPWRELEKRGVGADIPLDEPKRFQEFLQKFADMDQATLSAWSQRAVKYGIESAQDEGPIEQNLRMFNRLLNQEEPIKTGASA